LNADLIDGELCLERSGNIYDRETHRQENMTKHAGALRKRLQAAIAGTCFATAVSVLIILNCGFVLVEELFISFDVVVSVSVETAFVVCFTVEFALKFYVLRGHFWRLPWNVFDFVLVLVGILGLVLSMGESKRSSTTRLIKLARVVRSLRFLRVVRLAHIMLSRDKNVSAALDIQMSRIATLSSFSRAALTTQVDLVKFCCGRRSEGAEPETQPLTSGLLEPETEVCRCLLQSQTSVYKSWVAQLDVLVHMEAELLDEYEQVRTQKAIAEGLEHWVEDALSKHAIQPKQAHKILRRLHEQIVVCTSLMHTAVDGVDIARMRTERSER